MKILFLTFDDVSYHTWSARPVAIVRALADAGHRVDVIAAHCDLSQHALIRRLGPESGTRISRMRLRLRMIKALFGKRYDAVHAVGPAAFCVAGLCAMRNIPLAYDAACRYTGHPVKPPSFLWTLFPSYFRQREIGVLEQARIVFSYCETLREDLAGLALAAAIIPLGDVPLQPLFAAQPPDFSGVVGRFRHLPTALVVCSVLPGNRPDLKKPLVAARKVIDAVPRACFVFKGPAVKAAAALAKNLDIRDNCIFVEPGDTETFLAALSHADVALLQPHPQGRHLHPEVFTLLNSKAPLVAVQNAAYRNLLDEQNSISVLPSAESMAEGILRVIQEPLFAMALAGQGQLLVAEQHAVSSFNHKLRMAYLERIERG